jgi:hypothetical protein
VSATLAALGVAPDTYTLASLRYDLSIVCSPQSGARLPHDPEER